MKRRKLLIAFVFVAMVLISDHLTTKAFAASHFAICAHESHGTIGWTGPIRTGDEETARKAAQKDADDHNKNNKGHDASVS